MVKTDRNSAEDFCHPPGAVYPVSFQIRVSRLSYLAYQFRCPCILSTKLLCVTYDITRTLNKEVNAPGDFLLLCLHTLHTSCLVKGYQQLDTMGTKKIHFF